MLAYATYAKSFKSGGINLNGLPLDAANHPILRAATVDPESVDHFELGLKSQFGPPADAQPRRLPDRDSRLPGDGDQRPARRAARLSRQCRQGPGAAASSSISRSGRRAGSTLYFNGAYTDARYVRFVDAPCPPELSGGTAAGAGSPSAPGTPGGVSPANCDISGQWLPGISSWSASYGARI